MRDLNDNFKKTQDLGNWKCRLCPTGAKFSTTRRNNNAHKLLVCRKIAQHLQSFINLGGEKGGGPQLPTPWRGLLPENHFWGGGFLVKFFPDFHAENGGNLLIGRGPTGHDLHWGGGVAGNPPSVSEGKLKKPAKQHLMNPSCWATTRETERSFKPRRLYERAD